MRGAFDRLVAFGALYVTTLFSVRASSFTRARLLPHIELTRHLHSSTQTMPPPTRRSHSQIALARDLLGAAKGEASAECHGAVLEEAVVMLGEAGEGAWAGWMIFGARNAGAVADERRHCQHMQSRKDNSWRILERRPELARWAFAVERAVATHAEAHHGLG